MIALVSISGARGLVAVTADFAWARSISDHACLIALSRRSSWVLASTCLKTPIGMHIPPVEPDVAHRFTVFCSETRQKAKCLLQNRGEALRTRIVGFLLLAWIKKIVS